MDEQHAPLVTNFEKFSGLGNSGAEGYEENPSMFETAGYDSDCNMFDVFSTRTLPRARTPVPPFSSKVFEYANARERDARFRRAFN